MYTYLALGDSYTIGEQVAMAENFPFQTVALLRRQGMDVADPVINAMTGWTTDELARSIREEGIIDTFSFVSLLIGVNNQYRGRELDNYRDEFRSLLQQAVGFARNVPEHVFVLSIPDWGVTPFAEGRDRQQIARDIDAYNEACREISAELGAHFLDITGSTRENGSREGFLAEDGLHPSSREYAIWAERLAPEIIKALKQ